MSLCWYCLFQALLLLLVANGAPVITNTILGKRLAKPIDNGLKLSDGYRLLGNKKTWRGLFSAVLFTTAVAILLGLPPLTGVLFGTLTMTGDLLASFVKRRRGKVESSRARGLDTVPESLLPLLFLKDSLALGFIDILLVVGLFFLCEEFISPILYKWHIRNRPY
ncbi:MAG: CDP-archaeol synthase [Methylococcaceae bacterium]|nr:CDP-archaeol synthase [Methylococcaceae bacterium]